MNKKRTMKYTFAATLAAVNAFSNSVPVFGRYPGWVEQNQGATGITIDMFYDLLCDDSNHQNAIFNELMDTEWMGAPVREQVNIAFTPFVLPYHNHSFQVTQIVPYLLAQCAADATMCSLLDQYKNYCFTQLNTVLAESDVSKEDFIT